MSMQLSLLLAKNVEDDNIILEEEEEEEETSNPELEEVQVNKDICVECEDHASELFCEQCHDYFCSLCYESQHRKGTRTSHTYQPIIVQQEQHEDSDDEDSPRHSGSYSARTLCSAMGNLLLRRNSSEHEASTYSFDSNFLERSKYIPLRLTYEERKRLRTLEAALAVSDYTSKLDSAKFAAKGKRVRMQLQEICGFLSGLVIATDYKIGQEVLEENTFSDHEEFFQEIFELGRRYKIMNPEKMRGEYGKLMFLLQDAMCPQIQQLLGFSVHEEIKTVYTVLEEAEILELLQDEEIAVATRVVAPEGKTRNEIRREIKKKETAIKRISREYANSRISVDEIQQCLYSIGDNNYHLYFERDPIDAIIEYLKHYFDPDQIEDGYSLAIVNGNDGARLSHSHERQYYYVLQSLTLWREIAHDMFRLWYFTDQDLLTTGNPYKLTDTGQGLHRIQPAPKVSRAMHVILHSTQRKLKHWVGSSVIHLGDKNVANGLHFIDKYSQVGHILRPIVKTIGEIERLHSSSSGMKHFIDTGFGGVEPLRKLILSDLFREAFDGSGADNFFDAGSCVDGRLTSAWNWCSRLPDKEFFLFFKLAGFIGFDGKFV